MRRPGALRGAALAAGIILAVAALRGRLDLLLALSALAGLGAALAASGREPGGEAPRPGGRAARRTRAEGLLAALPDPVILVSPETLVVEANAAAQALMPALRAGRPLSFALRAPEVLDGVAALLRSGRPLTVEYRERGPAARVFEVRIAPGARGGGAPAGEAGIALVFRDVTAMRRMEQMRVDFIANASHELRTPLASLLGFIDTLEGPARDDPAARARFLGIMRAQASRMKRLVDDLLSLSRIELVAHVQPEGTVDLEPLVRQIADGLGPVAARRGASIAVRGPGLPARVRGDRDELLRLVENLVENALKYGRDGGRVEVGIEVRPPREGRAGEVELTVADDGPGIAPEHLPRLTERFYRVDVAESRQRGGTGLGLAIVKHIVARHRGRLAVTSRPGEGAAFRVVLPAAAPEGAGEGPPGP